MEKYCSNCGNVIHDLDAKFCINCGNELKIRYGRQPIPRKLRHKVFKRDGYRCRECGASKDETSLEIDHILPVAKGGSNDIDNLQTLCRECNRMKHTDEWIGGESDLKVAEKELEILNKKLNEFEEELSNCSDENQIIDYKFKIKKLEDEDIPKVKNQIKKLIHENNISEINAQKHKENEMRFKKLYLNLSHNTLLGLSNWAYNYFSLSNPSIDVCLNYLIDNFSEKEIYSLLENYEFEKLNTTTKSIYDLNDVDVLIILKDGTNLTNWDDVTWKYDDRGKFNSDIIFISEDLSDEDDLTERYAGLTQLRSIQLSGISNNVKSMKNMFFDCYSLVDIYSLSNLDVSNVENMEGMFKNCFSLKNIMPLSNWNTFNVENMKFMFYYCKSLIDVSLLGNLNVSNVKDMAHMFSNCESLINVSGLKNWDTSNVENMECMFAIVPDLKEISALRTWDLSNIIYHAGMFMGNNFHTDQNDWEMWDDGADVLFKNTKWEKVKTPIELTDEEVEKNIKEYELFKQEQIRQKLSNYKKVDRFESIKLLSKKLDIEDFRTKISDIKKIEQKQEVILILVIREVIEEDYNYIIIRGEDESGTISLVVSKDNSHVNGFYNCKNLINGDFVVLKADLSQKKFRQSGTVLRMDIPPSIRYWGNKNCIKKFISQIELWFPYEYRKNWWGA